MHPIIARLALASITLALAACALPPPQLTYPEGSLKNSETAVIMRKQGTDGVIIGVTSVNGNKTSCIAQSCPPWVRVKPGLTKIGVKADIYPSLALTYSAKDFYLEVEALPRHTYLIEYLIEGSVQKTISARIVDAGTQYKGGYEIRGQFYSPTFEP